MPDQGPAAELGGVSGAPAICQDYRLVKEYTSQMGRMGFWPNRDQKMEVFDKKDVKDFSNSDIVSISIY